MRHAHKSPRSSSFVLTTLPLLLLLATLVGCGNDLGTVPVEGKLTLDGGDWPKPGRVNFLPLEPAEGFPQRPGFGTFDTDGQFRVTTIESGDGLFPGTYRVYVECWEIEPVGEEDHHHAGEEHAAPAEGKSYVDPEHGSPVASPLEVTVEPGASGPVELEFDIPSAES